MIEILMPCPFCGETKEILVSKSADQDSIWCGKCGVTVIPSSIHKAAEAWNRRAFKGDKELKRVIEFLRDAIGKIVIIASARNIKREAAKQLELLDQIEKG